jgi:hypothetical protein
MSKVKSVRVAIGVRVTDVTAYSIDDPEAHIQLGFGNAFCDYVGHPDVVTQAVERLAIIFPQYQYAVKHYSVSAEGSRLIEVAYV